MTHVSAAPLASQLSQLLPYLILAGGALLVMLVDSFVKSLRKEHLSMLTLLVLLGVAVAHVAGGDRIGEAGLLHGMLAGDQFAWYFNLLFVSIALLTTTFASHYKTRVSLEEMLTRDAMMDYAQMATGEKYLVTPWG